MCFGVRTFGKCIVMDYLFILVHGTFATKAPWTDPDSTFCSKLKAGMGGNVSFETFNWSGGNSHASRIAAAKELVLLLERQYANDNVQKVIIAHSHGGNIAMYALRELGEKAAEFNLVTMATPFLNAEGNEYTAVLQINLFMIPFLLSTFLIAAVAFVFNYFVRKFEIEAISVAVYICLQFYKPLLKRLNKSAERIEARVKQLVSELSFARKKYVRMLTIIDRRDEITIWFRFLSRLWMIIAKVQKWFLVMIILLAGFGIIWQLFGLVEGIFSSFGKLKLVNEGIMENASFFFMLTLVLCLGSLVALTAVALILTFLKSNIAALGPESWLHKIFITINPSPTPEGYKKITYIRHKSSLISFSLKHSIYNNDVVIGKIVNWVLEEVRPGVKLPASSIDAYLTIPDEVQRMEELVLLFLAVDQQSTAGLLYAQFGCSRIEKFDALVHRLEQTRSEEIRDIHHSPAINRLDDVLALLCSTNDRAKAIDLYARLTKKSRAEAGAYVEGIVRSYSVDMTAEKEQQKKIRRGQSHKIPKRILAILISAFCAYVALETVLNSPRSKAFDFEVRIYKFEIYMLASYVLRTLVNTIIVFIPAMPDSFRFQGKTISFRNLFFRWILADCIALGGLIGFTPVSEYLDAVFTLSVPGMIIAYFYPE